MEMVDRSSMVSSAIDRQRDTLKKLSVDIWEHPELNFEEHTAHKLLTDYLESQGFSVERQFCGLETAFRAK